MEIKKCLNSIIGLHVFSSKASEYSEIGNIKMSNASLDLMELSAEDGLKSGCFPEKYAKAVLSLIDYIKDEKNKYNRIKKLMPLQELVSFSVDHFDEMLKLKKALGE
jgi:hypothetical protein